MDFSKINLSGYLPEMPYKVRELFDKATNDESWGPSGKLLQDLSQLSHSNEHYNEVNLIF